MNQIVRITKELQGIEESKAKQIQECFEPMVKMLEKFEEAYEVVVKKELSPDVCGEAKRLRLDISKVRIEADKVRKAQKDQYLRAGNAIQGVYNILRYAIEDKEKHLKDIETYYERMEADRIARLQEDRSREIEQYGEFPGVHFGMMPEGVWNNFLIGAKSAHQARIDAENKAEQERIEAEKQAERARKEQEKKRIQEAEERARIEAETRAVQEAERRKKEHQLELEKQKQKSEDEKRRYQQAVEAERRKAEDEKRKEAERIEKALKNKKHRDAIEAEIVSYMIAAEIPAVMAKSLVSMLAGNKIPNVQIIYW